MINYSSFKQSIEHSNIAQWHDFFVEAVNNKYKDYTHGEQESWKNLLDNLPDIKVKNKDIKQSVTITSELPLSSTKKSNLTTKLKQLHPWRKGPFNLFDIHIDTEWRSDWKWERIKNHLNPLKNKTILDVGCGNGYHCLRMLGEQARFVLGIDPSQKFLAQFAVIQKYLNAPNCHLLPLGIEDMPDNMNKDGFDSVFCMGVLYHRKSPIDLIYRLKNLLNHGGQLIMETLVVDGDQNTVLTPISRYAQMRNVWFLPSTNMLELWLEKCGFSDIKTININHTSTEEQRSTDWMTFHSLSDFLDNNDPSKTIEGYPAPQRATLVASKK